MRFKHTRAETTCGLIFLLLLLIFGSSSQAARLDTEGRPFPNSSQSSAQNPQTQSPRSADNPAGQEDSSSSSQTGMQPTIPTQPEEKPGISSPPVIKSLRTRQRDQTSQTPGSAAAAQEGSGAATAAPPAPYRSRPGSFTPGQPSQGQPTLSPQQGVSTPGVAPIPSQTASPIPSVKQPLVPRVSEMKSAGGQQTVSGQLREEPVKASQAEKADDNKEKISIDFDDVDIRVIIKYISEVTGQNFLIDDKVKGKVTIISPKKIPLRDITQVFLSILEIQGFSTVRVGEVIKILPTREVTQRGIETQIGKEVGKIPIQDRVVTQLVPLAFADATEMKTLLTPMISKNSTIVSYPPTNTLIITETQSNLNRLVTIVTELDIPAEGEEISVIQIFYATAEDMAKVLSEVLEVKKTPQAGAARTIIRRRRGVVTPTSTIESVEEILKIIPELRTNMLIIVATPDKTERIKSLIAKLDIERPRKEGNFHVIYLENADAEQLMTTLSNVAEKSTAAPGATKAAPGIPGAPGAALTRTAETGPPGLAVGAVEFKGKVKIAADKSTNSLIINAEPEDFQILQELIDKLDIRRLQVYVEAAIVEISSKDSKELGLEFTLGTAAGKRGAVFFSDTFGQIDKLIEGFAKGTPFTSLGGMVLGGAGGSVQVPTPTGETINVFGAIAIARAIESKTQANILATPHLLTMDNEEAEIVIANEIPFLTGTSTTTVGGNIQTFIDRRDVGITLRFTPTINESNSVKLKIFQEISNVLSTPLGGISAEEVGPTTQKRTAKSTLVVRDGQTIVIGGLMQDNVTANRRKAPCLGDIPGFGLLFRSSSRDNDKTNLLIFITPRIVRSAQDIADVTHQKEKAMEEFKEKQGVEEEKPEPKGFFDKLQRNKEFLEEW